MSTKFLSPSWRMPRNANQSKSTNYSLGFDGGNQFINSSPTLSGLTDITVSCWAKFENINNSDFQYVLNAYNTSQSGSYRVGIGMIASNYSTVSDRYKLYTIDGPNLNISSFVVSQDVWYNIVVTQSGTVRKLFVNGDLISTFTGLPSLNLGNNFEIGRFPNNNHYFPGKINSVSIFDYPLSQSQVTTLHGDSTNGPGNPMALPIPPKAYYPLGGSAAAFRTPVNTGDQWLIENNVIGDYVFDFDGSNTISIGDLSSVEGNDFTISTWLNRNYAHSSVIYNSGSAHPNGLIFQSNQNGSFFISVGGGSGTTSTMTITDGIWYNAILTVSGTTAKVYVNGSQLGSSLTVGSSRTGIGSGAVIGEYNHSSGFNFIGKLSNTQVFNTELSGPEVETLYNYGSPIQTLANIPQSSNLKAWYKLDATEIYNSTSTEWEVNNALSSWTSSLDFVPNDYIAVAASADFNFGTGDFTISTWVNIDAFGSFPYLFDFRDSSGTGNNVTTCYIDSSRISIFAGGSVVIDGSAVGTVLSTGVWYNIIIKRDSGTVTTHINGGSADASGTFTGDMSTTPKLNIGARYDNNNGLNGKFSNFQIFNTALSASDITSIYNNGVPLTDMSSFSSLVSWWKLDNTTTGIEDSKGSNDGTNNGATEMYGSVSTLNGQSSGMSQTNLVQSDLQTVAPYSKYALNFDGNDYIDCGNDSSLKLTSNFSVSAWMKSSNQSSFGVAFGIHTIFNLQMSGTLNMFKFNINGVSATYALNPIDDGKWHHVVCTSDGTTARIYVDNVKGNDVSTGATSTTSQPFTIGYLPGNAGLYFNGQISNVSYWSTALTQAQVTETYNEGLPSNLNSHSEYSNLVSWWQLGENSSFNGNDWIVADEIGSNNGESDGMGVDALTNGVGTTANGVSTGMSEGSLVGNAPYSVASTVSSNVAVQEFDPLAPSTVISGRSEDVPS